MFYIFAMDTYFICDNSGKIVADNLTKCEAEKKVKELKNKTPFKVFYIYNLD